MQTFQLPNYAPPANFTNDVYANHPRGGGGAASIASPQAQQGLLQGTQTQQDLSSYQGDQQGLLQAQGQANNGLLSPQQQAAVNGSAGMMPQGALARMNSSLGTAMQQNPSPGLSRYLRQGLTPGTQIRGLPQTVKPPPLMGPNPQARRLAGYTP